MGARAVRITREDFLTPPEFKAIAPVGHPAARVGGARIELIRVGEHTRLGACYQQVPVRLMPPFVFYQEPASLLYLINLTAGLMDGDGHRIDLTARAGTQTVVTGQSATRVHPAVSAFATQQWNVKVEDQGCLVVLPGPLIPFRQSRYYQRGRVALAPQARLIWGDVWLPGRYERGILSEVFQFERIIQDFEVRREERLIFRERFRWDGPWPPEDARWRFGGSLCSASLFVAGIPVASIPAHTGVFERSVFSLDSGDTCMRWCGPPEQVTADLVRIALSLAATSSNRDGDLPKNLSTRATSLSPVTHGMNGCSSAQWFANSRCLAPNHWFTPSVNASAEDDDGNGVPSLDTSNTSRLP